MARHKKKKEVLSKDFLSTGKKPEDFLIVDSAIWWEANPDKSKKYGKKEFKGKKFLTPKEAEIFLEISGEWLIYFMQGEKGFPKLPYSWDGKNVATIKFARQDLVQYRDVLRTKKLATKARPQKK
jgi:hypothetical protein